MEILDCSIITVSTHFQPCAWLPGGQDQLSVAIVDGDLSWPFVFYPICSFQPFFPNFYCLLTTSFCHFLSFSHCASCLKTETPLSHATLDAQWGSGNKNIPAAIRSYRMRKISVGGYTCSIDFLPQFWLEKFPVYNANNIYYLIKHSK